MLCGALSSCTSGPIADGIEGVFGRDGLLGTSRNTLSTGADTVFADDEPRPVNLVDLIDPENRRQYICTGTNPLDVGDNTIECAMAAFNTYHDKCIANANSAKFTKEECVREAYFASSKKDTISSDLTLLRKRTQIQDEIIRVSQEYCRDYKLSLNEQITKTNFALGSIGTIAAGLGSVFTDPTTARSLSGAAAILSGVRAEYNQAYLQNLTVQVVTKGIDLKRLQILKDINGARYGRPPRGDNDKGPKVVSVAPSPYTPLSPYEETDVTLQAEIENDIAKLGETLDAQIALAGATAKELTKVRAELRAKNTANRAENTKKLGESVAEKEITDQRRETLKVAENEVTRIQGEIAKTDETILVDKQTKADLIDKAFTGFLVGGKIARLENTIEENESKLELLKAELKLAQAKVETAIKALDERRKAASGSVLDPDTRVGTVPKIETTDDINRLERQLEDENGDIRRTRQSIVTLNRLRDSATGRTDRYVGLVPLTQYTLERAITDAVRYHGACTIPAGLEKAIDSVENEQAPGFETLRKALGEFISVQEQMNKLDEIRDNRSSAPAADDQQGDQ